MKKHKDQKEVKWSLFTVDMIVRQKFLRMLYRTTRTNR